MIRSNRRAFLRGAGSALLVAAPAMARVPDIIVSKSGRPGTVPTLAAAVAIARRTSGNRRLRLERGVYEEKSIVDVPNLHIAGDGPDSVISFGASAGMLAPDGKKWGTGRSATLTVDAPGVTIERLTIRNSFDFLANRGTEGGNGAQAVALSLAAGADRTIIRDCRIEGYQDTFYLHAPIRAYVRDSLISGNVDFIFGGAAALFDRCEIRSRFVPGMEVQGFVAAPSTPFDQAAGLVFDHCRLTREAGLPKASVYLGRPWRAGGNMNLTGAAAYLACWMDDHILPDGWAHMGYTNPAGIRTMLTPEEARLYEFRSRGPGAGTARPTRRMLLKEQLTPFTRDAMFRGWNPR